MRIAGQVFILAFRSESVHCVHVTCLAVEGASEEEETEGWPGWDELAAKARTGRCGGAGGLLFFLSGGLLLGHPAGSHLPFVVTYSQ